MLLSKSAEDLLLLRQRCPSKSQFPSAGGKLGTPQPGKGIAGMKGGGRDETFANESKAEKRNWSVREGGKNHLIGLWHLPN